MPNFKQVLQAEIDQLKEKTKLVAMPLAMKQKVDKEILALERSVELGNYDEKYEKVSKWLDWITRVPWEKESKDVLDVQHAAEVFNQHHYGMQQVKDRFLEYISVLKLRQMQGAEAAFRAPSLLLVGLVGTGKTTFAASLADALGRKLVRIPFGGMGSAKELRGESRLILDAEPGRVIKGICETGVRNPVILLDEIDRVAKEANRDIMGVLVELLDPAQNHAFRDNYIDYPVDLSHAIFLATANNTRDIVTAVLDRMEKISMPSYSDHEKIIIAQRYILPKLLKAAGLRKEQLIIQDAVWSAITRPLGFDAGIRTLQRTLEGAVRKAARIIVEKGYPEVVITMENKDIFLPRY